MGGRTPAAPPVTGALPTGTVTLLLADVEGSTRLWQTEPAAMKAAIGRFDATLDDLVNRYDGARPVEQGEGDSCVLAFARPSDAVACALDLQRADLGPIRLRIGLHSGEIQLRDEGNYVGPTINRCARLRDLAHGGQTVLSQATHDLVIDRLPEGAWLDDLGAHRLRDLDRPERVHQLGHEDLRAEFPGLRSLDTVRNNLPAQLTPFIGRSAELEDLHALLANNRLLTLTGAGGVGKTRLALHLAASVLADHPDGVWLVDLAPIANPDVVPTTLLRALDAADDPMRTEMQSLVRRIGDASMLVILDNCEHLIDASASAADTLLRGCPSLTILATSREPLGVSGEAMWRVPSLSLPEEDSVAGSEAVELFTDRARRVRASFAVTESNAPAVAEICRRLDGIPLAIELAAARVRAMSPEQIATGLHDRFHLLTGSGRMAVQRQQTLRASVDWSHHLLSEPERVLFRRLAAFTGTFELQAAEAVAAADSLESHQVLDQLTLLVDKSLVLADDVADETRYRMLETVRQYALDQLSESGEADDVRRRHRDYYLNLALADGMRLAVSDDDPFLERVALELDNLRTAFQWSIEVGDVTQALVLAVSLFPYWARGEMTEGRSWLDIGLAAADGIDEITRAWALGASAFLETWAMGPNACARADEALELARRFGADKRTMSLAMLNAGVAHFYSAPEPTVPLIREAVKLAREIDDPALLGNALHFEATVEMYFGDPVVCRGLLDEALSLLQASGRRGADRVVRSTLTSLLLMEGDLAAALQTAEGVEGEARARGLPGERAVGLASQGWALAMMGETEAAVRMCEESAEVGKGAGIVAYEAYSSFTLGMARLAAGAASDACRALEDALNVSGGLTPGLSLGPIAEAELAAGNLDKARERADHAVEQTTQAHLKWQRGWAYTARARIAGVDGDVDQAEDLAHQALAVRHDLGDKVGIADTIELLAALTAPEGSVRLLGAMDAHRQTIGYVRFEIYREWYESLLVERRAELGDDVFEAAWAEGAAMTLDEAVAYTRRGRGERKRPTSGWASLTPAELDVVRLVAEGLANKAIAEKLFISPRTVQAHLTHIYAKLGFSSRVQLATEAAARDLS